MNLTHLLGNLYSTFARHGSRWIVRRMHPNVRHHKGRCSTDLRTRKRVAKVCISSTFWFHSTSADRWLWPYFFNRFWEGAELIETKRAVSGKPEMALPATAGEGMVVQ